MSIDEKHEEFIKITREMRKKGMFGKWYQLADLIGVSANAISGAKNKNESYLTSSLLVKLEDALAQNESVPETISPSEITRSHSDNVDSMSAMAAPYKNMRCVPTIPIHAYRAINFDVMEYFQNTRDEVKMSPIIMQFPGTDCYYFVNSEDMIPHLQTNDLLCLSRLPEEAKVTNGDICILNTKYQGILERFVYDEGDHLLVKSTQPRWTDMRIPKDEIFNIFRILGGIRTNI